MMRIFQVAGAALGILRARMSDKYGWHREIMKQCERLGGVYIKFIQMLAVHQTTKHFVEGAELSYEQVAYEPIDIARELGDKIKEFATVASTPFAAGSYGQVYHATLLSGELVIIKILRPSVRRTLRQDLRILNGIALVLGRFTAGSIFDLRAITQEFSRTTYAETDYIGEAERAEWQRSYFDARATVVIPRTYPLLGSRSVLVQQYMPGISLAEAMSEQRAGRKIDQVVYEATGSNIWQQLDTLGTEFVNAVLYADYQMVDPHPGNIRFLADNKVALIDFGMVTKAPRNREAFVNMLGEFVKIYENKFEPGTFAASMLAFYDMELHDALQIVAREQSSDYMNSLEVFVREYMQMQGSSSLTQHYILDRQMARLFNEVINRGNKLGMRLSKENVMVQRSMNMFLSTMRAIGEAHDGTVHFNALHAMMSRSYQEALTHGFSQHAQSDMSEERAYEVAANWLTMIAEKDRRLYGFIMKRGIA